ncbi:hypothetical protein ABZZ74_02615 [Streptomyces sp. NPDC006476]
MTTYTIGPQWGADGTVHLVHRFAEAVAEHERDTDHHNVRIDPL